MSTTIQIKRSSTASAVPLSGDLAVGELAVNLADKRLFAKQADGTIIELSTNPTDLDAATLRIDGVEITASATELNSLDGLTATTAELNILDGVTATATELNKLDGFTGSTAELNLLDGVTATTAELNFVDGVTSNVQTQLNAKQPLDTQLTDIAGLTPTDGSFIVGNGVNFVAESGNTAIASLGVTATAAELNILDGVTATTTELNYTDGVTSNIQTQLNSKAATTTSPTITLAGDLSGSATLTNLGNATLTATVADDSHNHVISNVDGLQTALNSKANLSGANFTGSVDVTGTITADGLTSDGGIVSTGSFATLQARKDGGDTFGAGATLGLANAAANRIWFNQLSLSNNYDYWYFDGATPRKRATIANNGDVSFYEDTGTTAKMVWSSSAESLGIGTSSPISPLHINGGGGTTPVIRVSNNNGYSLHSGILELGVMGLETFGGASSLGFRTNSAERMRIDSAGNVGIGTASPNFIASTYSGITINNTDGSFVDLEQGGTLTGRIAANSSGVDIHSKTVSPIKFWINDSERARIDSSGRLGIGTTSPNSPLTIQSDSGGSNITLIGRASDGYSSLAFKNNANTAILGAIFVDDASDSMQVHVAGSERARIDSSGNLLVAKSAISTATVGHMALSSGLLASTRSGGEVAVLNRLASDGDIIQLRKDGATVGSIGVTLGNLDIDSGSIGRINLDNTVRVISSKHSGQPRLDVETDNSTDLGGPIARFKNLYLSGGVYLGGTGAANKLDDYEEGTFTPVITGTISAPSVSYSTQDGQYTKVGRVVYYRIGLRVASISGGSGTLRVSGLPFNSKNYTAYANPYTIAQSGLLVTSRQNPIMLFVEGTQSTLQARATYTNTDQAFPLSEIKAGSYILAEGFYEVS